MKRPPFAGPLVAVLALTFVACGEAGEDRASEPTSEADRTVEPTPPRNPPSPPPEPGAFTRVLDEIVVDGRVDWDALQDRRGALRAYLEDLSETSPEALEASSGNARLAFWINAYNACMLDLVAENLPLADAGGLWNRLKNAVAGRPENSVWQIPDVFTRPHCRVAGQVRSQDEIEHRIIRPMGDPRIHFAVNCAALGCPSLAAEAYAADRLDDQLEQQVARFMEDPRHYRLEMEGGRPVLWVNRVLEWFGDDFGGPEGVAEFFAVRAGPAERSLLRDSELAVRFMEYDWTLNDAGA